MRFHYVVFGAIWRCSRGRRRAQQVLTQVSVTGQGWVQPLGEE
jgi:hypothetical protein